MGATNPMSGALGQRVCTLFRPGHCGCLLKQSAGIGGVLSVAGAGLERRRAAALVGTIDSSLDSRCCITNRRASGIDSGILHPMGIPDEIRDRRSSRFELTGTRKRGMCPGSKASAIRRTRCTKYGEYLNIVITYCVIVKTRIMQTVTHQPTRLL